MFPETPAWKALSDRHKTQNKAFTHFEGIIDQNTVDDDSIQDGITLNFRPAAKKSWKSQDIDTTKLAEFSITLIAASEPIYQDARNILIKLAQTTPEVFNDNWSYTTGYITNSRIACCKNAQSNQYKNHVETTYKRPENHHISNDDKNNCRTRTTTTTPS
jgi:hypothetical protein